MVKPTKARKGTVTAEERRRAVLADRDKGGLERIGLAVVQRLGVSVRREALRALSAGRDPIGPVEGIITRDFEPILASGMVAAHVGGIRRFELNQPKLSLSVALEEPDRLVVGAKNSPFREAVSIFQKRAKLSALQMDALEDTYGSVASKVCSAFSAQVNRKLTKVLQGLAQDGAHIREAKRRLSDAFDSLGIMPDNSFTLEGIFRTQMAVSYSSGSYAAEQDPDIQEILWGYRYVTVGDDRVRFEHAGFDGVTLPKEDPFWDVNRPPNGWACRCECIPIFDERDPHGPVPVMVDGEWIQPTADPGFAVNFGQVYYSAA